MSDFQDRSTPPIDDQRAFPEVLRDWLARHDLSHYAAAKKLGIAQGVTVSRWAEGAPVRYERAIRALMTLIDEGRA